MSVKKVLFDMVMGVIVEKEAKKEKITKSGIIITSESEDESPEITVEVTKVGSKVEYIEVGDRVLIQPYGNNTVVIDNQEYVIFRENVAICILD